MEKIKINEEVPRSMTLEGLEYLGRMAQSVPKNGTIVEVGPLYGSSTWVLSKNAHPSVKVYSIDTWEDQPWIRKRFPDAKPFSIDAFKYYIRDCENVEAIQGWSPAVVSDWKEPIHMFFDDATHGDPGFTENIEFFRKFLVEDGIICGDDFASGWPDIVTSVNRLATSWKTTPEVSGRVWSMMNGGNLKAKNRTVAKQIGNWIKEDIVVEAVDIGGETWTSSPRMWCGPIHQRLSLLSVKIKAAGRTKVPDLRVQYQTQSGSYSDWLPLGETFESKDPITNMRAILVNGESLKKTVEYQLCQIKATGQTENTQGSRDGIWVKKENKAGICGIKLSIKDKK